MTGGTFKHSSLALRFRDALFRQLPSKQWAVSVHDRGVETEETIRYPDVVVEPLPVDPHSLSTAAPAIVVEIISRTSEKRDLGAKPMEYPSLTSLHAYIAASQDGPECWIWQRGPQGAFLVEPMRIVGHEEIIAVASLGVKLELAEIYAGGAYG